MTKDTIPPIGNNNEPLTTNEMDARIEEMQKKLAEKGTEGEEKALEENLAGLKELIKIGASKEYITDIGKQIGVPQDKIDELLESLDTTKQDNEPSGEGIPLTITKKLRQLLNSLGISKKEIGKLTAEEAWKLYEHKLSELGISKEEIERMNPSEAAAFLENKIFNKKADKNKNNVPLATLIEISQKIKNEEDLNEEEKKLYGDDFYKKQIENILKNKEGKEEEEMLLPEEIELEKVVLADLEKNATAAIEKNRGFFTKTIDGGLKIMEDTYGENEDTWKGFGKRMTKKFINLTLIAAVTVAMKEFVLSNVFSNVMAQTATSMATKYGTSLMVRIGMGTAIGALSEGGIATGKAVGGKELSEEKLNKLKKWLPMVIGGAAVLVPALLAGATGAALLGGGSLYLGYELSRRLKTDKLGIGKGNEDKKIEAKKKLLDKYHIPEGATEINLSKDDMEKFEKDFEKYIQFCNKMDRTKRIKERAVKLGAAALTGTVIAGASMGASQLIHPGEHNHTTLEAKQEANLKPENEQNTNNTQAETKPTIDNHHNITQEEQRGFIGKTWDKWFGGNNDNKTEDTGKEFMGDHKGFPGTMGKAWDGIKGEEHNTGDQRNEYVTADGKTNVQHQPDADQRQEYVTPNKVEDTGKEFMGDHKGFPGTMGKAWDGIKGEEHNIGDQRNEYVTADGKTNVQHQPEADHGNNQPNQPEVKLTPEQIKDIMVHKGEGIESTFIRQIEHNPGLAKELGYNGDPSDAKALHAFAGREAHILAIKEGYVDKDGHEVRIAEADKIGYGIKMENGHATINEISADGKVLETHHEGDKFGVNNKYEYVRNPEVKTDSLSNTNESHSSDNMAENVKPGVIESNTETGINTESSNLNKENDGIIYGDKFEYAHETGSNTETVYGSKFEYADKPEYQADANRIDTNGINSSTHHHMTPSEAFYFTQENLNKIVGHIFHSDKLMYEYNDQIKNNMTANDLLKMHHDKSYPDDLHSHELKQLAIRMEKIQEITGTKPETHIFGGKEFDESVDQYLRREILEIEKMGMMDKIKRWL